MSQYGEEFWKLYSYVGNLTRVPVPEVLSPKPSPRAPAPSSAPISAPSGTSVSAPSPAPSSHGPVVSAPRATTSADVVGLLIGLSISLWIAAMAIATPIVRYGSDTLRAIVVAAAVLAAVRLLRARTRHLRVAGASPTLVVIGRAGFAARLLAAVTLHGAAGVAPHLPALLDGGWSSLGLSVGDLATSSPDLDVLLSPFMAGAPERLVPGEVLLAAAIDLWALATILLAMVFRARDAGFSGAKLLLLCVPPLNLLLLLLAPTAPTSAKP
jgi:hypothetical protein